MKKTACFLVILLVAGMVACTPDTSRVGREAPPYIETGVDPEGWALVPAGEFLKGHHLEETMVDYDYEIMVTHVTNAQYAAYLNEALAAGTIKVVDDAVMGYYPGDEFQGYNHEFEVPAGDKLHVPLGKAGLRILFGGEKFTVQKGFENHPVVMVTWFGAKAYCDFRGLRMPTEVEWEKAARGTDERPYPWGEEITLNHANFHSSRHAVSEKFGDYVFTTPVGLYNGRTYGDFKTENALSPYGVYDMAGNAWQWTGDDYPYTHLRFMRGGSSANYEYNLRVWRNNSAAPDHYGMNIGFRCVRDVGEKPPVIETEAGAGH